MSLPARRAMGGAIAAAIMIGVAQLSRVPYAADRASRSVLRLAWRARGDRVEECRHLTPEELERLPPHMRSEEECTGRVLPYRLDVALDGTPLVDALVRPAGARGDRPLYVFDEISLVPGRHRVAVTFVREGAIPPGRERDAATPSRLALDTTLTAPAGRALLVTYDEEQRRLVVKRGIF